MKKVLLSVLCLLVITGCGCNKKEENKNNQTGNNSSIKTNTNKEFLNNQTINGIEISNVNLSYQNEVSTFTAVVTNKLTVVKKIGIIDIVIKDENKNEIITLKGLIDKNMKVNESASINASTSLDLTNAKYVEYRIK